MTSYILLASAAILFIIACLWLLHSGRERMTLALLFAGSLIVRLYMAMQDAFLHDWDERFHALVARNLMNDPLQPILRAHPVQAYDKFAWCCNHIWLHKQPLFMWQMALSMKLFGVSELTMRYPSVLMGALMPLMVYGIARQLLHSRQGALVAALLMALCNFQLELISGFEGTDHNDVAFGFYVLASFWAYVRYLSGKEMKWVLLAGVFAGCAVLNKWLTGAVVFAGWGMNLLLSIRDKDSRRDLSYMLLAAIVCLAVFLPWQLYILHTFPEEAKYEYAFNSRHITEVLEDHKGSIFFYVGKLPRYYGAIACCFIPVGMWVLLRQIRANVRENKAAIALLSIFTIVFSFFSLIVATKWVPYAFVVAPMGYLLIAAGLMELKERVRRNELLFTLVIIVVALFTLNPVAIYKAHNSGNEARMVKLHNTKIYKEVTNELPKHIKLVLNTPSFEDIDLMFYHNELDANAWCLHDAAIDSLIRNNVPFAVFEAHGQYGLPERIAAYKGAYIIHQQLK